MVNSSHKELITRGGRINRYKLSGLIHRFAEAQNQGKAAVRVWLTGITGPRPWMYSVLLTDDAVNAPLEIGHVLTATGKAYFPVGLPWLFAREHTIRIPQPEELITLKSGKTSLNTRHSINTIDITGKLTSGHLHWNYDEGRKPSAMPRFRGPAGEVELLLQGPFIQSELEDFNPEQRFRVTGTMSQEYFGGEEKSLTIVNVNTMTPH